MNARRRFRCCDEERNPLTPQTNHNINKTTEKEEEVHKTSETNNGGGGGKIHQIRDYTPPNIYALT